MASPRRLSDRITQQLTECKEAENENIASDDEEDAAKLNYGTNRVHEVRKLPHTNNLEPIIEAN